MERGASGWERVFRRRVVWDGSVERDTSAVVRCTWSRPVRNSGSMGTKYLVFDGVMSHVLRYLKSGPGSSLCPNHPYETGIHT